jgi:hypothetical protein
LKSGGKKLEKSARIFFTVQIVNIYTPFFQDKNAGAEKEIVFSSDGLVWEDFYIFKKIKKYIEAFLCAHEFLKYKKCTKKNVDIYSFHFFKVSFST